MIADNLVVVNTKALVDDFVRRRLRSPYNRVLSASQTRRRDPDAEEIIMYTGSIQKLDSKPIAPASAANANGFLQRPNISG